MVLDGQGLKLMGPAGSEEEGAMTAPLSAVELLRVTSPPGANTDKTQSPFEL